MARANKEATATIEAENIFTDHIHPMDTMKGLLNLSISGLTDSTVTVQRTYDAGTTWRDVVQYAVADSVNGYVEKVIEGGLEGREAYRVGVKTGDYGTDTVVCLLTH
jgi:hypothetical protein